jgi:adenine-specific DNA methylase
MDCSLDWLRDDIARSVARAVEQEAARQGHSGGPLTHLERSSLRKRALLREAAAAAEMELLVECAEAGRERFGEVYRARRSESQMLRDLLGRAES